LIDDSDNPDIEFVRYEFMESLVRLAKLKFGRMPSSIALDTLLRGLEVPDMVEQMDIPTHDMLRNRAVQCYLFDEKAKLHKVYETYVNTRPHSFKGCRVNDTNLTLPAFLEMLQDAGILGLTKQQAQHRHIHRPPPSKQTHGHGLNATSSAKPEVGHLENAEETKHIDKLLREARFAFAASQNDLDGEERRHVDGSGNIQIMDETLTFEEFTEAICRMTCLKYGQVTLTPVEKIELMVIHLDNVHIEKMKAKESPPQRAISDIPKEKGNISVGGIHMVGKLRKKARNVTKPKQRRSVMSGSVSLPAIN
jgi:hypothetical protein